MVCKTFCYNVYMLKVCSVCFIPKDPSDYYVKDSASGRLHAQCKACYKTKRMKKYHEYYNIHKEAYRARAVERKTKTKKLLQSKLYRYLKNKKCEFCGFNDIRALEFDHIDSEQKRFGIARAINDCYSWVKIEQEIKKCRILCANCHRIRTAEQQRWSKWRLGRVVRQDSAKVRTLVQIR